MRPRTMTVLAATVLVATAIGVEGATPATAAPQRAVETGGSVLSGPYVYAPEDLRATGTATTVTLTGTPSCQDAVRCELAVYGATPSSPTLRPLAVGSQAWPSWVQPGEYLSTRFSSIGYGRNGNRLEKWGAANPVVARPGPARTKLTAEVRSVDPAAKSAVLVGTATKGARVSIGGQETTADTSTGAWSITVTGLSVGTNSLTVIQKINGFEYDRLTRSVVIEQPTLDPVTVTSPATVQPGVENRFTGTATPGATFRVLDASGNPITPGRHAVDENGEWEFATTVPAGVTSFRFAIEQTAKGQTVTSELFTFLADTRG